MWVCVVQAGVHRGPRGPWGPRWGQEGRGGFLQELAQQLSSMLGTQDTFNMHLRTDFSAKALKDMEE